MTVREFMESRNLTEEQINICCGYGDGGDADIPARECLDDEIEEILFEREGYAEIEI